jgi:carboxylesterase type B
MFFVGINLLLCLSIPYVNSIINKISYGDIEGRLLTTKANNTAFAYLGVPFGQNPIGELRFRKPIEPHPWTGALNCTTEKAGCMGDDTKDSQSEDCLYLDILQPKQCQWDYETPCAVFVYAHSDLTTDLHSFVDNLVQDDIIVVVVPHRQGVFGFLNLPSMPNEYDQNAGIHGKRL